MPSAQGVRAGAAYVELGTKNSPLVKGLKDAERKLKAFGSSIASIGTKFAAIGAAGVTTLFLASKRFANLGSELNDMSERTGVSAESLQELGYAAQQNGADMETLEAAIRKMSKTVVEASQGSTGASEALAQLGLTARDLANLTVEAQFKLIADRLSKVRNDTLRAALALDVFGKSGTKLLPMIKGGIIGLREYAKEARNLGIVLSNEDIQAADAFGDKLDIVRKVLDVAIAKIGAALVPILTDAANWFFRVGKTAAMLIEKNRGLIETGLKVAAAMLATGVALTFLGESLEGVGSILGAAANGLNLVRGVLGALSSPIGLVTAAVAGLGVWFLTSTQAGGQALAWLGDRFSELKNDALSAWKGIGDALATGDIGLAAKILWLTLKMEWQKGVNFLQSKWQEFAGFFTEVFSNASFNIAHHLTDAWASLQVAWVETTTFLANTWDNLIGLLQKGWNRFAGFFAQVWARIKGMFGQGDADAEIAKINADVAKQDKEINTKRDATIAERDTARQKRRDEIERDRGVAKEALVDQQAQAQADREAKHEAALSDAEKELAQARAEWEAALAEAEKKRAETEKPKGLQKPSPGLFTPEGLDAAIDKAKVDVVGTFNAAAVQGLGAESLQERTAKATETVATNTRQLVNQARQGRLVFVP
jgi:hypothetical protein